MQGGLKAVLWTDVLQGLLMILTIITLYVAGIKEAGGVTNIIDRAREGGRLDFNFQVDLFKRYSFWNGLLFGVCYGFGGFGANQVEVQRLLTLSNVKRAKITLLNQHITCYWSLSFLCSLRTFSYGFICIGVTFTLLHSNSISQVGYILNSSLEGPTTAVFVIGVLTRKGFGKKVLFGLLTGYAITCWIGYSSLLSGYQETPLPQNNSMCTSTLNITYDSFSISPACHTLNNCSSTVASSIDSESDIFILNKIPLPFG
ncbi:sodium-coupled monocarboxylate transporter 1 [Trichonephila inaurata madagascariensis]|uniref:Sodium-coupled monocarboxylate transporter 1 n=1 Tax=Trichonephila inaurata madagascariensis TaxID=2747483 RepID=A0A8X6IGT6_9ARAC|nr:sodium-coupled monocarboxylate transporter 1 [Trichonephila inaurata madagascariensis]